MATTQRNTNHNSNHNSDYGSDYEDRNSRELQREIERTRHQMDETLEQLGERLHPRHLFDMVVDYLRPEPGAASRREYAHHAKVVGGQLARQIKRHPVPALLIGAGLAYLLYEELPEEDEDKRRARRAREMRAQWDDIPEHSGSFVDARTGEPYDDTYGADWKGAAWSDHFEWSQEEEQKSWSERATRMLGEIKSSIGSGSLSARDKLQARAAKLMSLSGHKRHDIESQWARLGEHSLPYNDPSSRELHDLTACDFAASHQWTAEDEAGWSEKAQHALEEIQQTLSNTGASAKDTLRSLASHIGDFVGSTRDMSADYGGRIRRQGARMRSGSRYAAGQMRSGSRYAAGQVRQGYAQGRDQFSHMIEESPLAVGAAFLGLGMIAGLILPATRREDELMGEASDNLKRQAVDTSKEIAERGQQIVAATAEAAAEELEKEGLTPHQLADKARKVAADVTSGVKDTVREEAGNKDDLTHKIKDVAQRVKETAQQEVQKHKEEMQR
jgi:hypothetical protein